MKHHFTVVLLLALHVATATAGNAAEDAKINAYVDLVNRWTPQVQDNQRHYLAWADAKTGPTCKERGLQAPTGIPDSAERELAKVAQIEKAKPALPIDATVGKLVAALTALAAPTREAAVYYGRHQFKDDACKRGQELHAVLVAQWAAYLDAEHELRAFLVDRGDKEAEVALDAAKKKYGTKLRYHFEKSLMDSKLVLREIEAQLAGPDAKPDVAAIETKLATLGTTLDEVGPMADHDKIAKPLYDDLYSGGYIVFLRAARDFQRNATTLVDKLRAGRAKEIDTIGKALVASYNQMIANANKVRFSARVQ